MSKNKGKRLLVLGWIAFAINIFIWWGNIVGDMGFPILNWQAYPIRCFATILGEVIGINIFTILAFFAGLRAWKGNKNSQGRILAFASLIVFSLSFLAYSIFSFGK